MWEEADKYSRILLHQSILLGKDNNRLKDQLMTKRKDITDLKDKLVESVNETNLVNEATAELKKRRDEFLKRVMKKIPDSTITNFPDYKYWLSEPFIVDNYGSYEADKSIIDGISAIKGLGKVLEKIEEDET